jgi:CDP-glucose 4,6-dehydratase
LLNGKNILLTGVTGLLGSHIAEEILNTRQLDVNLIGLIRDRIPTSYLWTLGDRVQLMKVVYGDIRDFELVKRAINEYEIDLVIHLAAQPIVGLAKRNPLNALDVNIMGTVNVLEAVRQLGGDTKILLASSDKAYGRMTSKNTPYTEANPLQGEYPYDVSKSCADLLAQSFATTYKMHVNITRCGNLYGPGDHNFNRIIPDTIWSYLHNRPVTIRSDGTFVRDYLYVKDAVDAYITIAEAMFKNKTKKGEAFNISTSNHLSVCDVVLMIQEIMKPSAKAKITKVMNEASNEIPYQTLDASHIKKKLGWESKTTMEENLKETIDWYTSLMEIVKAK